MAVVEQYQALMAELSVRHSTVRVRGGDTRYWVYGDPDAATTIVAIHGFRGDHHGLEPIIAHLRGIRVIAPDLPGFGESSALGMGRHDIAGYTEWLAAFVDALQVRGTAIILGHSFGSIVVAAAVAGGLPTPKLILVNPIAAPALRGPNRLGSLVTLAYYRLGRALPSGLGGALLSSRAIVRGMSEFLAQTQDRDLRRWIHDQHGRYFSAYATRDSVVEGFEASISSHVSQFAPRISTPALLIGADRDPITSVADQRALATLFPDATIAVLAEVGHLIHYEKPREAAELIVGFLGDGHVPAEASR